MDKDSSFAINIYFCELSTPDDVLHDNSIFTHLKDFIQKTCLPQIVTETNIVATKSELASRGLIIAFAKMQDLSDKNTYDQIFEDGGLRSQLHKNYANFAYPVILIGLEDFTGILNKKRLEKRKQVGKCKQSSPEVLILNSQILEIETEIEIMHQLNLDPRVKFFDSCIWYRYVPLNCQFEKNFINVLKEIFGNFDDGYRIYETNVAREFLEFQTRMMVNSYLTGVNGGHASDVTPYKFHSEMFMRDKVYDLDKNELNEPYKKIRNFEWRALLIDDYGNLPLRTGNKHSGPTKKAIIEKSLKYIQQETDELHANIEIEIAQPENKKINEDKRKQSLVAGALMKLDEKMYDLIFLDYLLGEKNIQTDSGEIKKRGREYGHELLAIIDDSKAEILKNKGPLGRFWIFPISAFSYAMLDELREQGIFHLSEHWHLSSGADPVNTPNLFRYKLYKFMNLQIGEIKSELGEFLQKGLCEGIDLNKKIRGNVTKQAKYFYSEFVHFQGNYRSLLKDKEISIFAKTMYDFLNEQDANFVVWEHMHNLLYLLAFGAGSEWAELWEEYNFVSNYFIKLNQKKDLELVECFSRIQEHIMKLKRHYK